MNQNKTLTVLGGGAMILVGGLALLMNVLLGALGVWAPYSALRVWPLTVMGLGLGFCAIPLVVRGNRWLGALFIPGVIVAMTGGILLFTSVTGWWGAWSWLWPQEVMAVALGFFAAMVYTRSVWLGIPLILVGVNAVVLQFCALTGWWSAWAVLWPVEPFAVGLVLLLIGAKTKSAVTHKVGLGFCAFSVAAGLGMMALLAQVWWFSSTAFAVILILLGAALLARSTMRARAAAPVPSAGGPELR